MDRTSLAERLLRRDKAILLAMVGVLFALTVFYTVLGVGMEMSALEMTAMRGMKDMPGAGVPGAWSVGYAVLVFLMWWIMMMAMMLPSVSPTVLLYASLLRHKGDAAQVPAMTAVFLAGYLIVWAFFSLIATGAQWGLEALGLVSATMMTLTSSVPGALVLIAAGAFQFTALKATCLEHCRSPAEFLVRRRRSGFSGAFLMGTEHGAYCLGCCWFLMALLFVGGIMNLYWIVALSTLVALEKLSPVGSAASKAAGAVLFLWGIWVLLTIL